MKQDHDREQKSRNTGFLWVCVCVVLRCLHLLFSIAAVSFHAFRVRHLGAPVNSVAEIMFKCLFGNFGVHFCRIAFLLSAK